MTRVFVSSFLHALIYDFVYYGEAGPCLFLRRLGGVSFIYAWCYNCRSERTHYSEYDDQRHRNNICVSLCGLDARTNGEMRAECHLIVNSLSSFRDKRSSTAANVF